MRRTGQKPIRSWSAPCRWAVRVTVVVLLFAAVPTRGSHQPTRLDQVLFDNGPFINCSGCGALGADESVLQREVLDMGSLGFQHDLELGERVTDDFVVPAGHVWACRSALLYAYQTGSELESTLTEVRFGIWDGFPGEPESNLLVAGSMDRSEWSGAYRVTEGESGDVTTRPIMESAALPDSGGCTLSSGQYWIDWASAGTRRSGPHVPPVTLSGRVTTGDAKRSNDDGITYTPVIDDGTLTPQGLPFKIRGGTTGPTLSVTGVCPGVVVLSVSGGTPGGEVALLSATFQGASEVPGGVCRGSLLGLLDPLRVTDLELDDEGELELSVPFESSSCGTYLEMIDLESCAATTVGIVPVE